MIPKIIHCFWAGGAKTKLSQHCRTSWEKYLPSWKICEWGLSNFPELPSFCDEAVRHEKWAFVADWVRFVALYREGGVYLDCDFELLSSIEDLVMKGEFANGNFLPDGVVGVEGAVLALEKGSPIAKAMLGYYETAMFDDKKTVGEILASILEKENLHLSVIAPEVFSPIDVHGVCHRTEKTLGIHHYAMSWATPERRIAKWLAWHGMRRVVELVLMVRQKMKGLGR